MATDLLLFSFYFPPYPGVGARRWGFLSRFFAENGYSLTVLTSPLSGCLDGAPVGHDPVSVHAIPMPAQWQWPVPGLPLVKEWLAWRRPLLQALERIVATERPRLLIFTGGPFFSFILAPGLGKRFHVPVWLDFRDAWGLGSHIPLRFSAPLVRYLERRAIRYSRIVTDVTAEMSALRRAAFPGLPAERFQVLENGFDGNPGAPSPPSPPGKVLRLGIWGKFCPYHRDHSAILAAAAAAVAAEMPVQIHHFGVAEEEKALVEAATRGGLANPVQFHGYSDYEAGLAFLAGMDAMVLNHRSPLLVGTKVYDAIRMNRPVLAFCRPDDALARLIRPFRHAYPVATLAETTAALREIIRARPGCLDPDLNPEPYSRRWQGEKFLPVLASLLGPR